MSDYWANRARELETKLEVRRQAYAERKREIKKLRDVLAELLDTSPANTWGEFNKLLSKAAAILDETGNN